MDPGLLTTLTHRAMATEFAVILPACEAPKSDVVLEALEQLDGIEARLTIYRESSEVARVNRDAARSPVRVSDEVFGLLQRAVYWSQRTAGAFDITAGPLVEAWGFTKRTGQKPSSEQIESARQKVGYEKLVLDSADRTVSFAVDGMSINLGGIGKGYALDSLSETLTTRGVQNFLLHGGQSSVIARGHQNPQAAPAGAQDSATTADAEGAGKGWAVGISHPTKPQHRVAGIWLRDMSLGTSGSGKQFFHHQGRRYGHVIDPRTGYPAGDLLSLTVLADSAADADASATGYFVAGSESIPVLPEPESRDFQDGNDKDQNSPGEKTSASGSVRSMIAIAAGKRQDSVQLRSYGDVAWVAEPQ